VSSLIVDTNAYGAFLEGNSQAVAALSSASEVHIPLIVLGELLAGFAAGSRPEKNRAKLEHFMASRRASVMLPDEKTAHQYALVFLALRSRGRPVPTNDLWIAALARQHRMPLLTFDGHFSAVPGLELALGP
jgi:predicted nucleic acid-binding protein